MKTLSDELDDMLIPASYVNHVAELMSASDYKATLIELGIDGKRLFYHDAMITGR